MSPAAGYPGSGAGRTIGLVNGSSVGSASTESSAVCDRSTSVRSCESPHAQADPTFPTPFAYTRITAAAVRDALLTIPELAGAVPTRQTAGEILNRLGYKLRRVLKARPHKKFPRPTPSSPTSKSPGPRPRPTRTP